MKKKTHEQEKHVVNVNVRARARECVCARLARRLHSVTGEKFSKCKVRV